MITVSNDGRPRMSIRIGDGRSTLPTPTGTYFIVDLLKQPNPYGEYSPYAFGLSAFSDVLQSFTGGPREIEIHGTDVQTTSERASAVVAFEYRMSPSLLSPSCFHSAPPCSSTNEHLISVADSPSRDSKQRRNT